MTQTKQRVLKIPAQYKGYKKTDIINGINHKIYLDIHPTKSWWSKVWNDVDNQWVRYKTRFDHCRTCDRWFPIMGGHVNDTIQVKA